MKPRPPAGWRPPTRRAFVAMLGAAGAALALRPRGRQEPAVADPPPAPLPPVWIGHC